MLYTGTIDTTKKSKCVIRLIVAGTALVAATIPAWGQKTMPREETFRRSAQGGQEVRVFTYAQWHRDCSPQPPPRIVLRTSPAHGTVSLRPGPTTVSRIRDGMPDCIGRTYQGLGVWYVPSPGFQGVDQFDWDVIGTKTESHDAAVVDVR